MINSDLTQGVFVELMAQLAAFLALLLAASAMHKWMRWPDSMRAVHEFAGVPHPAAAPALVAVGLAELLAAALLLGSAHRAGGAGLAALIWGTYLALMLRALAKGRRDVVCGCSFGGARHPLGAFEVSRNALLALLALILAFTPTVAPAAVLSRMLAAAALVALYGALDQVMAVQPLQKAQAS